MSNNGLYHDVRLGGVTSCFTKCPKTELDEHAVNTPIFGSRADGKPTTDLSDDRLDAIVREFLSLAQASGIQYDNERCDFLASVFSGLSTFQATEGSGFGDCNIIEDALNKLGVCKQDFETRITELEGQAIVDLSIVGDVISIERENGEVDAVTITRPVFSQRAEPSGRQSLLLDGQVVYTSPAISISETANGERHNISYGGVLIGTFIDQDTVSPAAPEYTFSDDANGDLQVFLNGNLISTIDDQDTISPAPIVVTYRTTANGDTEVLNDGVVVHTIQRTTAVINQVSDNEYQLVVNGQVSGTFDTIPDTDQGAILGSRTVNADGSITQCFTTVWMSHPTIAAGTPVTTVDDICFDIPARSQPTTYANEADAPLHRIGVMQSNGVNSPVFESLTDILRGASADNSPLNYRREDGFNRQILAIPSITIFNDATDINIPLITGTTTLSSIGTDITPAGSQSTLTEIDSGQASITNNLDRQATLVATGSIAVLNGGFFSVGSNINAVLQLNIDGNQVCACPLPTNGNQSGMVFNYRIPVGNIDSGATVNPEISLNIETLEDGTATSGNMALRYSAAFQLVKETI